ncbi:MAG: tetratricopeptide repeat protein [Desulfomonilaceae bacterium]
MKLLGILMMGLLVVAFTGMQDVRANEADEAYKTGLKYYETQDDAEALKWFRKAADQGSAEAQFNMGDMYQAGKGVTQDYVEAQKWFHKAADQGSAEAQVWIGAMYEKGKGVAQDSAEALKWYRKAADLGFEDARRLMEKLESKMLAKAQTNRADCRITKATAGFRDKEAFRAAVVATSKQVEGDFEPVRNLTYWLLAEGRIMNLDKGEKVELLKVDQMDEESIMQIRIPGKGVMWIAGPSLECQ